VVGDVPADVVTVTSTTPTPAGEFTLMEEGPTIVNVVTAVVPKSTALAPVNPVPVMVTAVPPAGGPVAGETEVTVGQYVNWSDVLVAVVPAGDVTVTSTVPVPAGETAVIFVSLLTVNDVAAVVPNSTVVAPVKPLPRTVTLVPPDGEPEVGLMLVTAVVMAAGV
jgi:hypothetical protein